MATATSDIAHPGCSPTLIAAALASLLVPRALHAQAAPGNAPNVEPLHAAGLSLRGQDRPEAALRVFQLAFELHPDAVSRARMALAEIALQRFVEAEEHLQQALEDYPDAWVNAHQADLTAALTDVRRQLGTIEITCNVPGAELWLNGARYRTLSFQAGPQRVRVLAGQLHAEIRAEGHASQRWDFEVPAGATRDDVGGRIHAVLVPVAAVGEQASGAPTGSRAGAWVLMGVGAAALGTSAVLHLALRAEAMDRFEGLCRGGICAPENYNAGQTALDDAGTYATLANVFLGVGAASAVGGFAWWLASRPSSPRPSDRVSVQVGPSLRAAGAALQLTGSF